jgi:acyl-CoA reductase-like NAD-dependent aldehyde dehydrogenase
MPDFRADVVVALMSRLEAFGDEFARLAHTKEQKLLAEAYGELVGEAHTSIVYIAEASRRYRPPGAGLDEPAAADRVSSPADLVDSNGTVSQQVRQQMQGRGISV